MTASGEAPIQITAPAPAIRVLHLAQSDGGGGANKAAFRLHRSLRDLGVASTFHPGRKIGDDPDVIPAWPPIAGENWSWASGLGRARVARALPTPRSTRNHAAHARAGRWATTCRAAKDRCWGEREYGMARPRPPTGSARARDPRRLRSTSPDLSPEISLLPEDVCTPFTTQLAFRRVAT